MSYKISRKEYYSLRPSWIKKLILSIRPSLLGKVDSYTVSASNLQKVGAVVEEIVRQLNKKKSTHAKTVHKSFVSISPSFQKTEILMIGEKKTYQKKIEKSHDSIAVLTTGNRPVIVFKIEEI